MINRHESIYIYIYINIHNTINSITQFKQVFILILNYDKQFCKFRVRDPSTKKHLCFRICDSRGVEEGVSINGEDLGFLLDGNLPNNYTVSTDLDLFYKKKTPFGKKKITEELRSSKQQFLFSSIRYFFIIHKILLYYHLKLTYIFQVQSKASEMKYTFSFKSIRRRQQK